MSKHNVINHSIELLLRPIARLCLRRSLKFQDFVVMAKRAFVYAAEEELKRAGIEGSMSRFSVMTGLQRPDIAAIRESAEEPLSSRSLISRIIGQWSSDRKYRDRAGKLRIISFEGRESEFSELVAAVSKELNSYAVIFELERLGLVEKTARGLKLLSSVYISADDMKTGLGMLAMDVNELVHAVESNLFDQPEVPHLHLHAHYDNICVEDLPKIRKWCLDEGSKFIHRVQQHLAKFDKDVNRKLARKKGGCRVTVGAFSHSEF